MKVPITRPALGQDEVDAAVRVVQSGWVTQGPEVAKLEAEFARAVGAAHAVAVSNCTVALELALRCVGVRAGDDVATVSHSFVATANAVRTVGARPVFVDVDESTFGMDAQKLEAAITPKTTAILCVHQIGMPCDLEGILRVAQRRGIPVVEDAACAIGSELEIDGVLTRIGKPHGTLACFSLHPRKIVTTGDGGMLTTADAKMAARLRMLRQHGMTIPDTVRHGASQVVFEEYVEPAFNYRMTDLQAAIGLPQLMRLSAIVAERRALAKRYTEALLDNSVLEPPREPATVRSNWQSYPVRIRPQSGVGQIEAMQFLLDLGVASKRGISNAHQEKAYADRDTWSCGAQACSGASRCSPGTCRQLSVSENLRDTTILIPLFHGMTCAEQDHVIDACNRLQERHKP